MNYLVPGLMITNSIAYADGRLVKDILGGSVYALSGIKLYTDEVMPIANVGEDFESFYGEYMEENRFSRKGIRVVSEHTVYDHLTYHADGRWDRASIYGERLGLEMFGLHRARPEDAEPFMDRDTKGVYMAIGLDRVIWKKWAALRQKYGYKFVWELITGDCIAEHKDKILSLLPDADIWSINLPEAKRIFSAESEEAVLEELKKLATPCFFRVGEKGAYYVEFGKATFVPGLPYSGDQNDPTGCGNTSTGVTTYALAEGYSPAMIVSLANVAAHFNVRQLGPIRGINPAMREMAFKMAKELSEKAVVM